MRAIVIPEHGGPEVLTWQEMPDPHPAPGEVVIEVAASAVNRADVLQRQGLYPPPPGASEIPGLECSGVIAEIGENVEGFSVGDRVCALLAGGGYAERVAVPYQQVMPIPDGVSLTEAAAFPEVACTVWSNVFMTAGLREGETLLVHGGGSGIGTFAIQLAKARGARVLVTAGSAEKLQRCFELGADDGVNYRVEDFAERFAGQADVILDIIGAAYLPRNIAALATGGRLVVIGLQGGTRGELNLGTLLAKRASVHASGLRARPVAEKAVICREVVEHVWPLIGAGRIRPVVHAEVPLQEAARAHRMLEASEHVGKILLVR
ncbi:NAD(P)H-quinone oxidoreductase [Thermobispora bispora]|jgi:putative PIG3 family NAD(P)H quinone oxidoreductase|uniref:NAD(P)H quinone oxidoreductase, PIG3 family n=1 Tax=Thermobispora bispora (strain ATCC 19993 / DSM 43833 / CBS 139.67 / JCM 10125 / KCTC 9307 / NBRC 14880 / R51) TaxID=469371 RepID=D6Y277_THEBD|nr:NAD(P)H-quinone oxidoreductase [Thermobispora bispora]ADG86812.1 NAD(P)H quinone oxidoreductase, PIG3 family [Thermobispora bispora DSM 43833]MBO2475586.1 NADPH:quinone oxidoreductase [Actinomycetales bacterium]MBX6168563.1 NAD(P)H-quinone oxidoreductase [Thermobispora bispora]QSI46776.1 NAD(P)H-quinone oxidoreductase [Thermobispora bispora]